MPRNVLCPESEWREVWAIAPAHLKLVMLLCRDAGLRASFAARLTAADINPDTMTISTRTKGGSWTTVETTLRLREMLRFAMRVAGPRQSLYAALAGIRATETSYSHMDRHLKRCRDEAGCVVKWGFHDLRRTGARELYARCRDLRKVQAFLGHRNLAETLVYLFDDTVRPTAAELESAQEQTA